MDTAIAVSVAAAFTILLCVIEVRYQSKASFPACVGPTFFLYLLIFLVGNIATTLFASATITPYVVSANVAATAPAASAVGQAGEQHSAGGATNDPNGTAQTTKNRQLPAPWFWFAFLGVFAFEVLVQNINITFVGKGVLSINDWISRAREAAIAAALEAETQQKSDCAQKLAARLKSLSEADLNGYVLNALGPTRLTELDKTARDNNADPRLTKALALAYEAPGKAAAIQVS